MVDSTKAVQGIKYDNKKPSLCLIDPDFLEGLAKVLDYGAEKYGRDNWRVGLSFSRLISSAYRHLGSINKGEDLDSESNLPHVYHLASNIMFLSWMMINRGDLDDRTKTNSLSSSKQGTQGVFSVKPGFHFDSYDYKKTEDYYL